MMLRHAATLFGAAPLLSACGGGGPAAQAATLSSAPASSPVPPAAAPASSPPAQVVLTVPPAAPAPPWAAGVPTDTWHTLSGTAFRPWADANIPPGAYRGTDPFGSIVNAFSDPAHDPAAGAHYFYGGGHGDGTCNAVCKFDHQTLKWSLAGQPTPPSVYPAGYPGTAAITYPSGVPFSGWFLSANELTDPRDQPHAAPALARVSTHMYAAAVKRGTRIHYFYLSYAEFDTATGQWLGREVDLGAQLVTYRPQYNKLPLQQGTVAVYDEVTDRIFVTLNPGDSGGGWRSGIMVFNPMTRAIESIHETNESTYGLVLNSINICRVGRSLYCFTKIGFYDQPQVMNQGFIFDMDSRSLRRFVITGDTAGSTYASSNTQDTIPSFFDGVAIRRWNYQPADRDKIYSVNPTPIGGTGTTADPYVLKQSVRTIAGPAPTRPLFVYSRLSYHGGAKCALLLPEAGADWVTLKLS